MSAMASSVITSGTAVSASGTSVTFSSIPSWVKRVTVMFRGVSTNGSSPMLVQIGSGSITTTGYVSTFNDSDQSGSTGGESSTSGFVVKLSGGASAVQSGVLEILSLGSNAYVSFAVTKSNTIQAGSGAGDVALSGALDRVVITTANGTDTFDAGTVNILYS
jgi:hypothetical protein